MLLLNHKSHSVISSRLTSLPSDTREQVMFYAFILRMPLNFFSGNRHAMGTRITPRIEIVQFIINYEKKKKKNPTSVLANTVCMG